MRVEFRSEVRQPGRRSDPDVLFSDHICVFEFKYNPSAESALGQV